MPKKRFSRRSPVFWLFLTFSAILLLAALGPAEKSLGGQVRVVYLHGAWVWAALAAFVAAGLSGLAALLFRRSSLYAWSCALGRTGLIFWITYLPLSLWAMQANWNGLFLAEPRWRLALAFAAGGLLLQVGLALAEKPAWTALGNLFFSIILLYAVTGVQNIMHPGSPIFSSGATLIEVFFTSLFLLTLLAAFWVALWLKTRSCSLSSES
jgi:hypothetical protein